MKKTKQKETEETSKQAVAPAEEPIPVHKAWRLPINRYWVLLSGGLGLLGLGVWVGGLWLASPDLLALGFLTIVLLIGGVVLVIRQVKHRHDVGGGAMVNIGQVPSVAAEQVGGNGSTPNSLNIYAANDEDIGAVVPKRIVFENVYEPVGQPQRCLNTNKDYYVHIWSIEKNKLVPFVLPDLKYTDPSILARYLGLPAQRKYLRNRESLIKLIGPGILAVAVIGAFITIIALSGG